MSIYDILRVKPGCSLEEIKKAKQEFDERAKRIKIPSNWIELVNEQYNIMLNMGVEEYNNNLNIKVNRQENGPEEEKENEYEDVFINLTNENNRRKVMEERLRIQAQKSKPVKKKRKFTIIRTSQKRQAKDVKKAMFKLALVVAIVGLVKLSVYAGGELYERHINNNNIGVETNFEYKDFSDEKSRGVLIEYEVQLNDTKSKIVNKLELTKEESQKIPDNIFKGQKYKLYVNEDIAEEYNYNNKIIKAFLGTYELEFGGTLYEIASYFKDAYPEVFGNMSIGEIKEQIARDNGCTTQDYQAKTYVINCYKTQAELDRLVQIGAINTGKQI